MSLNLIPSRIKSELTVDSVFQQFNFSQNISGFQINNAFVSTPLNHSFNRFELRNKNLSGFRFVNETSDTDISGSLGLFRFEDDGTVLEEIFSVSNTGDFSFESDVTFNGNVSFSSLNLPKLGIGVDPTVDGRIQFANTPMDNKISLRNTSGNDYNQCGFGCDSNGATMYHAAIGSAHNFFLGSASVIPLQINALGLYIDQLKPVNSDFRRIMFYDATENAHQIYNIGIKDIGSGNYAIHSQVAGFGGAFTWGYGIDSSSSRDIMRLGTDGVGTSVLKILNDQSHPAFSRFDLVTSTGIGRFLTSTTALGTTTLKAQLANPVGSSVDLWTGSLSVSAVPNLLFNCATNFDGDATIQNNRILTITGNAATADFIQLNNTNAASKTQLRINQSGLPVAAFGYDAANSQAYIDTPFGAGSPLLFKFGGITKLSIDNNTGNIVTTGNLGLGNASPNALLQLNNVVASRKIVIFEAGNNDHQVKGFGHDAGVFRFQINQTADSYVFYAGVNSTTSNEVCRITGTGNLILPGTIFGKMPRGYLSMSGNATGAASVANTWVKIAGTTVLGATSNLWDMPVNNRLRYTGATALSNVNIGVCLTFTYASSVSTKIGFSVFKNGVLLADSPKYVSNVTLNLSMFVSLGVSSSFSTNDYIEIYFNSPNGGVTLTGTDLSIITG